MKKILPAIILLFFSYTAPAQSTWELLNPTPSYETGREVLFTSATKGFIITANELLVTQNSGSTWVKKMDLKGAADIDFLGNTGYIAGDYGFVLVSKNGGDTWTQINTGSKESFNTVQIIDETTVILSGSKTILRSEDAGATWKFLGTGNNYDINKAYFTSTLTGHVATDQGVILKTKDGGETWYVTESTNIYPNSFFNIVFVNEMVGFASKEHSTLLKTTDGGETWNKTDATTDALFTFSFLDENTGFAAGDHGAVYRTDDGGKTWEWISFQNGRIGQTNIFGIHFLNKETGFVVGDRGMILKTTDGGNSWQPHSPFYTEVQNLQFLTEDIGYASIYTDLLKTSDGGKTWKKLASPVKEGGFYKIEFLDETTGYATVGVYGYLRSVYKTVDGGESWVRTNNNQIIWNENFNSLDFIDKNVGFVSGGYNQKGVFKTTNGGDSWLIVEDLSFAEMHFPEASTGYGREVGYHNRIYKTTDTGENWEIVLETEDNFTSMYFVNKDLGYVAGEYGVMYKTTNGGESWRKLDMQYANYTHVKFFNENVGYTLDEGGGIWKTIDGGYTWERISYIYGIKAIDITEGKKVFLSGTSGKILKSSISYEPYSIAVGPAEEIFTKSAWLTGKISSNSGSITDIKFVYGTGHKFDKSISAIPATVESNKSAHLTAEIKNLLPATTYQFMVTANVEGTLIRSGFMEFTTESEYELNLHYPAIDRTTNVAKARATVISNNEEISEIEFQYGTWEAPFAKNIAASPAKVPGKKSLDVEASITDLEPDTRYYIRIKALHAGKVIYSQPKEFMTWPEFTVNLYAPQITDDSVSFVARVAAYNEDIEDLVFEFGTREYEYESAAEPGAVPANSSGNISSKVSDLDPDEIYYYRVKGTMGAKTIYSKPGVFRISKEPVVVPDGAYANTNRTVKIQGLINPGGKILSNIRFEYGTNNDFNLSVPAQPDILSGNNTTGVSAVLDNLIPGSSYTYRIKAQQGVNVVVSEGSMFVTEEAVQIAQDVLSLKVTNETCEGKNNAGLLITAKEGHDFILNINGEDHEFTNELLLENLAPGNYSVCVTAKSAPGFLQCFDFEISAGKSLNGMVRMQQSAGSNSANIRMQEGTAPFTVNLNGKFVGEYYSEDFSVKVQQGDKLEITSMTPCEGVLAIDVDLKTLTAFPNPASSILNIVIPYSEYEAVEIEVYNNNGSLLSSKIYEVTNSIVSVPVENLATGNYFAVVKMKSPKTIKFSKK